MSQLRSEAEARLARKPVADAAPRSADALVHELQVHRIELEMQNEALRKIQSDLEESRDRYANLYEFAPVGYLSLAADGRIADINLTGTALLGSDRQTLLQQPFGGFVTATDRERWTNWFRCAKVPAATGQSIELQLQRSDQTTFFARLESRTLLLEGQSPIMRIALSDISERKQAEIVLAQYKEHLEELVASRTAELRAKEARIAHFSRLTSTLSAINRSIVFSATLDEVFLAACRACVTNGGYKLAWVGQLDALGEKIEVVQSFGQNLAFLDDLYIDPCADYPEGRGPSASAFREQRAYICNDLCRDPASLCWQVKAKVHGIQSCIALPISCDGVPRGVLTAYGEKSEAFDCDAERVLEEIAHSLSFAIRHFADEAEKRKSAAALQESEALLQEAQKVAALGHWTYLVAERTVKWSPQIFRLFGRDPMQPPTDLATLVKCYQPDSAQVLQEAISRVIHGGERVELELRLRMPDKQIGYHALALIPRRNEQGQTVSLYGTIQDISEHKRTEEKLLRLAEQLVDAANEVADLYQNAPCGYHSLDRNGVFCLINDTELRWLGYSADELIGKKNIVELLTPASTEVFHRNWPRFLEGGMLRDIAMEFIRKDGTILPVLISATALRDENGAFLMSRSTVYDMTELRKMEQERADYSRRLAELSRHLVAVQEAARRQLSGELHDRTSPNLAAIDINFSLISRAIPGDRFPELAARLEDTRALIKDTAASIREICADLRPPVLDYAGLPAALETYAHQFAGRTGIRVSARSANQGRRLSPESESLLFRIAQESLTNCAKHSKATSIDLVLDNEASPVVMTISDDGAGFSPELLGSNGRECGLGILNMREMAEFAGGKFTIDSAPGTGTRIRVEIP